MNDNTRRMIAESIDIALESFNYVNKEKFYHTLETKHDLKLEDIPDKYDLFHNVLSETFGIRHFAVERKIFQVLHQRVKSGLYDKANEIPAFALLIKNHMEEVDQAVKRNKVELKKSMDALDKIKKSQA